MQKRKIKIVSTGKYLPKTEVTAKQLAASIGTTEDWILKKSGVEVRYFAQGETASQMGAFAAKNALEAANLSIKDIDCIISTSGVPEQALPCNAALIQQHLGAEDSGIPAFDINSTCLSFITGLDTISYLIAAGRYKQVLLVATEVASQGINWQDKESSTLFGDGAAAVIISSTQTHETAEIITSRMETYSKGAQMTECRGGGNKHHPTEYGSNPDYFLFRMDGRGIFRLTSQILPGFIERLFAPTGLKITEMQMIIPHQASLMAIRLLRSQLDVPAAKVMVIAHNHGNAIAASIPMALHEAIVQGKIKRGDKIMLLGTSAGFSVGGIVLEF